MLITADGSIFHGTLICGQISPNQSKADLICDQLLLFTILCVKLTGEIWHGSSNFFHCCENYLEFSGFCASGNTLNNFAVFFFCRFLVWMFTLLTETFQTFILIVLLKMKMKRRWQWWCWWWWWCWWCWWWWWWRRLVLIALQLTAGRKRDQSSHTSLFTNALAKCHKIAITYKTLKYGIFCRKTLDSAQWAKENGVFALWADVEFYPTLPR